MAGTTKRNGKIELLRFLFAIIIVFYHINRRENIYPPEGLSFFQWGCIGVEFFLLVSGYLMAASADRRQQYTDLRKETLTFVYKKFMGILPYHLIVFAACLVTYYAAVKLTFMEGLQRFFQFLPNFLLIQKTGLLSYELLTVEWYVTAMLVAMVILYPLILKYRKPFTQIVCPLLGIWLVGYMSHGSNKLCRTTPWLFNETVSQSIVRGIAEIAFGVFCYEVVKKLNSYKLSKGTRATLTVIEVLGFVLVFLYSFSDWSHKYQPHAFYLLAISVTLAFSNVTYGKERFDKKWIAYLGRLSLSVFMSQAVPLLVLEKCTRGWNINVRIIFCCVLTGVLSVILDIYGRKFGAYLNKKIEQIKA